MFKINTHPVLEVPTPETVAFTFNGKKVVGEKGFTIAAALHQAGFPVHSHSLDNRERSLEWYGSVVPARCWLRTKMKRRCIGWRGEGVRSTRYHLIKTNRSARCKTRWPSLWTTSCAESLVVEGEYCLWHDSTIKRTVQRANTGSFLWEEEVWRDEVDMKMWSRESFSTVRWDILEGKRVPKKYLNRWNYYVRLTIWWLPQDHSPSHLSDGMFPAFTRGGCSEDDEPSSVILEYPIGAEYRVSYQFWLVKGQSKGYIKPAQMIPFEADCAGWAFPSSLKQILVKAIPGQNRTLLGAVIAVWKFWAIQDQGK